MTRSVDFIVGKVGETSVGNGPACCGLDETVTHGSKGILVFEKPFLTGWDFREGFQDDSSAGIHACLEAADSAGKRPESDPAFGIWTNSENFCHRWRLDEVGFESSGKLQNSHNAMGVPQI